MTIADYLNAYSYRVIPQDAVQYPWKSQAFVYLDGHYRMGAQVFTAFSSSIFGVTTDRAYMPVTALMPAISFLTLSGFLRSMAASLAATLAALSLYFTNVYYIYEPAIINFLPQIPGISCVMLLFAEPADRAPRSDAILRGVAGAGILLFYPEIAIFAVCGAALSFGLSVYRRRMPAGKALESLAVTLGVAVLINPVTAYYAVHSLLLHSQSKSGFNVVLTPEKLLRSIVGYQDPIVSSGVINSATSAPGFSCSPIPALSAKPVCCQAPAAVKSPELWIDGRIVLRRQGPNAERAGVPDRRMNTVTAGIE